MTLYPYESQLVVDANGEHAVLPSGSVGLYDPTDTAMANLLAIVDPTGLPMTNPLQASAQGFLPAFQATIPQVMWSGGGYHGYISSYQGLLTEAQDAKAAAESAAAAAQAGSVAPTDEAVDAAIARVNIISEWKASTAYEAGQAVVSPDGRLMSAISAHTSGTSYDAKLWKDSVFEDGSVVSTTTYTPAIGVSGKIVELSAATAVTVTIPTVATAGWPVGTVLAFCQYGAGQVTFAAASGVTLRTPRSLTTRARYATVRMRMRAANEWVLEGDMT